MKHQVFVPIKDREQWSLVAMMVKTYPGQASMTAGVMVDTGLGDLAALLAQWPGSLCTLPVEAAQAMLNLESVPGTEPGGNGAGKNARKAPRATGMCPKCGRTGLKLGKKSGMCANCNLVTAQDEGKLANADRRAGGGMQVLAQGMRRGSGQALKARKLG